VRRAAILLWLALAACVGPLAAQQGKTDAPAVDTTLEEMSGLRLFAEAWACEHIDLDYDGAVRAYEFLARRGGVTVRLRNRALVRLIDLYRITGNAKALATLFERLAKDTSLRGNWRKTFGEWAAALRRTGPQRQRLEEGVRNTDQPADSAKRAALREQYGRDLRQELSQVAQLAKRVFGLNSSDFGRLQIPGLDYLIAGSATAKLRRRARELDKKFADLTRRVRESRSQGMAPAKLRQLQAERQRVERELRDLHRQVERTAPYLKRRQRAARLRQSVGQLERDGQLERADGILDKIESLERGTRYARKNRGNLGAALVDVVARRRAVRRILGRLPAHRRLLAKAGLTDNLAVLASWQEQVEPMVQGKRWGEAASLSLKLLQQHKWLRRLWGGRVR
jgi:hypothetical protein